VVLDDGAARWLLVLHAILSVATVASVTHLVVWMRGYPRGNTARHRAVRKFAVIAVAIYGTNMIVGNVVYPSYRVAVRAEYLDAPNAVADDMQRRAAQRARMLAEHDLSDPRTAGDVARAARSRAEAATAASRWFDIKEHWVALGFALLAGLTLILVVWSPKQDGDAISGMTFLMALGVGVVTWLAGIVGLLTVAWRAV
jgi:hypothetical protein